MDRPTPTSDSKNHSHPDHTARMTMLKSLGTRRPTTPTPAPPPVAR